MAAQEITKSLAQLCNCDRVRRTTSFRVSTDLKCRLLATEETYTDTLIEDKEQQQLQLLTSIDAFNRHTL